MLDDSEIRRKRAIRTAITKRWRAKHRDAWNAYVRERGKKPEVRAAHNAYRAANRDRINARIRAKRAANLEAERAKARIESAAYRQRQREREAADPVYRAKRKAKRREYRLRWEARHPERVRSDTRRESERKSKQRAAAWQHERNECELRAAKSRDVVNQIREMSGQHRAVELPVKNFNR